MGQIWGLQQFIENVFIQSISNLASVLIGWVFRNFLIFGPMAKFLAPCCQSDHQINKALCAVIFHRHSPYSFLHVHRNYLICIQFLWSWVPFLEVVLCSNPSLPSIKQERWVLAGNMAIDIICQDSICLAGIKSISYYVSWEWLPGCPVLAFLSWLLWGSMEWKPRQLAHHGSGHHYASYNHYYSPGGHFKKRFWALESKNSKKNFNVV